MSQLISSSCLHSVLADQVEESDFAFVSTVLGIVDLFGQNVEHVSVVVAENDCFATFFGLKLEETRSKKPPGTL